MVWPSFSELQFAAGVTRELEVPEPATGLVDVPRRSTNHQPASLAPELRDGLTAGSIQLAPLFISYTRAEKLTRPHAREWQRLADRGFDLSDGYFRFKPSLGAHAQHNTLVTLGEHRPLVFYALPLVVSHEQYRQHASTDTLRQQTVFIQCGTLRQVRGEEHAITVTATDKSGVVFPEPQSFPVRNGTTAPIKPAGIEQGLTAFQPLREEFRRLRSIVERDTTAEQGRLSDYTTQGSPTFDDPSGWMRSQQRFFREALDTEVLFVTDFDGD